MSQTVEVSTEIFSRLEEHAVGFDTPAKVIERLLDHFENGTTRQIKPKKIFPKKDYTKYIFADQIYGKGRLVLAVVKNYVKENPNISSGDLIKIFPDDLQGGGKAGGVFTAYKNAHDIFINTGTARHYIQPNETIKLADEVCAVSSQWGVANIDDFINHAKLLGYKVETTAEKSKQRMMKIVEEIKHSTGLHAEFKGNIITMIENDLRIAVRPSNSQFKANLNQVDRETDFLIFIYKPEGDYKNQTHHQEGNYVFPMNLVNQTNAGKTGNNFNPKYVKDYEAYLENFNQLSL